MQVFLLQGNKPKELLTAKMHERDSATSSFPSQQDIFAVGNFLKQGAMGQKRIGQMDHIYLFLGRERRTYVD